MKGIKKKFTNPADEKKWEEFLQRLEEYRAQQEEFLPYLEEKLQKKENEFFRSMYTKLTSGILLTENMVKALRKCMERDRNGYEQKQPEDVLVLTLKVKQWWAKKHNLDSLIITGVVKAETQKAYLMEGHADMIEKLNYCVRCGRELTEPASMVTGMGKVCADKAGIPYDPEGVLGASKAERKKIRERFIRKLREQRFEAWVPKSQIDEVIHAERQKAVNI